MVYITEMLNALWVIGGLILIFIGLAAMPLRLHLRLGSDSNFAVLHWGPLRVIDSKKMKKRKSREQKATKAKETVYPEKRQKEKHSRPLRERWESAKRSLQVGPRLLGSVIRFGYRLLRLVRVSDVSGVIRGGVGDPALTGAFGGWMSGLTAAIPAVSRRIIFEPDYLSESLRYELIATVSFTPLSALGPTARFLWEAPLRESYLAFRQLRGTGNAKKDD